MAIKKSELYSSLWASCDELRGGMDASQYKDYVLTLLFVKYISDKYKGRTFAAIKVPDGASFEDMVALVGTPNIGDDINRYILNPIKEANHLNDFPDFNDEGKLGKGKDLIDTVSNLILIFNSPDLDFSGNNAEGDDLLGDAYEYLMRHFATESGKSKGQFYTPAEVSRVLAKVIGINKDNSTGQTTAYDPTCGSGSLLLKVADEAEKNITLYGQEKDNATANLAKMNMILHGNPTAEIVADNTLTRPFWTNKIYGGLKTFDYVVANPPFSLKNWSNGVSTDADEFGRFELGVPPEKNGDYAFLLHILKSLKTTGKGAVVLPHGVLFRGNAEAAIRKNIIDKGYIKGIIGLPANLFYGTGIPACILVLDKEQAEHRKAIFMIDASKGFVKDGNKNRLQEKDIRKIVDVFNHAIELPKYSRMVPVSEIANEKNDYNLNIPRYIDTQEEEDKQDLFAHLNGGIPRRDVELLNRYWAIYPELKNLLFALQDNGYYRLQVPNEEIKQTIFTHPQFLAFSKTLQALFDSWKTEREAHFRQLTSGFSIKPEIATTGERLLNAFADNPLIDAYDMYQHLMSYWNDIMQDDLYAIAMEGWQAGNLWERQVIKGKRGKDGKTGKDKTVEGLEGVIGKLIPPRLLIDEYLSEEWETITQFENKVESIKAQLEELDQENELETTLFAELDKVTVASVKALLKEKKKSFTAKEEIAVMENYIQLNEAITATNKKIKEAKANIEQAVIDLYPQLTEEEIKEVVINKKWMRHLQHCLESEQERISQNLSQRVNELAARYAETLPQLETAVADYESKVKTHLHKMGLQW
ncbi:type I restriction enzyme M protein [Parabacteroides sp. PFB2-12]|uniref:type I restriction-modification system subunit M n=1 Tax=unclassified Parabacteroides TaxID=2649774 RepID=UPI002474095E|nr:MULTISPECIES: type I restriction-modification system subunit M [unclassified Parabacteroides]MDH6343322.1 type I restriction enzyme M protein [Parabacteroides sp. PM6-13]MDH6390338.1 type I restriction enzyme M protein [Parabacteroides sp. PFB2-12]